MNPAAHHALVTAYLLALAGDRFPVKPIVLGPAKRPS
jgi:hypothetical protein